jgi:hypothetical protein
MYDLNMYVSNTPLNYNVHKYAMHVLSLSILSLYYIEYILASQIIAPTPLKEPTKPSTTRAEETARWMSCRPLSQFKRERTGASWWASDCLYSLSEVRSGFRVSKQDWAVAFINQVGSHGPDMTSEWFTQHCTSTSFPFALWRSSYALQTTAAWRHHGLFALRVWEQKQMSITPHFLLFSIVGIAVWLYVAGLL